MVYFCSMQQKIVLIGGPGTGKTSVLNELIKNDYYCMSEISREVTLKAKKEGIEQLFLTEPLLFSTMLLEGREQQFLEAHKSDQKVIFFDRGIPDVHAYMDFLKTDYPSVFLEKSNQYKYDKVFLFSPWKEIYTSDNERYETFNESLIISNFLQHTYKKLGIFYHFCPFWVCKRKSPFYYSFAFLRFMSIALEILQKYWGHTTFRSPQEKIIESVLDQNDVIALLPTGGGKSICFQIPALVQEGICIVISPLIALMQDQVDALHKKGIKALTIPSGSSTDDIVTLFDNLKFGNYKFLYISPERLQSSLIQEKIKELHVNLIAIDEAHCISEWGHDFRPSYRNIKTLRALKPTVNFIALTASATQKVIDDIIKNLTLQAPQVFKKSFFRQHLAYQVFTIEDKLYRLKQLFTKTKKPAIVYVNTRRRVEKISSFLTANGFKNSFYHGGLSSIEKQLAFENWMTEKTTIMVATNAFGMGIDKSNVHLIVHLNLPNSIENYLQEAGRAGRNGKKSFSVVLQNNNDIILFKEQIENSLPKITEIKNVYKKLSQYFQIAKGELLEASFNFNFLVFCKKYNFVPNKVATVLKILSNNSILRITDDFNKKSTIQFITNSHQVLNYGDKNKNLTMFIDSLLRSYIGLFEQETKINEFLLAKKTGITSQQVIANLKRLENDGLIIYNPANSNSEITFLVPREDDRTINKISKEARQYIKQKHKKATDLINFIQNNTVCRSVQVLQYFDEKEVKKCRICDVCLAERKSNSSNLSHTIIKILKEKKALSSKEISEHLLANEKDILIHLRNLLSSNSIAINNRNKFYLNQDR